MTALIRAADVHKIYGAGALATTAVTGVSVDLRRGELVLLMGPSGSGKTTLISILAGLSRASGGRVELCGEAISELSDARIADVRRRHVGFVFQSYNLFAAMSALDNVAEVLRLKGASRRDALARARAALARVGLEGRLHHKPGELSGGQQQRVAIARAIALEPSVIIGDEITSALDGKAAQEIMEIMRGWVGPSTAVLLVTHDHRLVRFADRVIEMIDGKRVAVRPGERS